MPYITLTEFTDPRKPAPIWINITHIVAIRIRLVFAPDSPAKPRTYVELVAAIDPIPVRETPDEILGLIEEQEARHA